MSPRYFGFTRQFHRRVEKEARLRELLSLVAKENNPSKRAEFALELERLLDEERSEEEGGRRNQRRER